MFNYSFLFIILLNLTKGCVHSKNEWINSYPSDWDEVFIDMKVCGITLYNFISFENGVYINNITQSSFEINEYKKQKYVMILNLYSTTTNKNNIPENLILNELEINCLNSNNNLYECSQATTNSKSYTNTCSNILTWFNIGLSEQSRCSNSTEIDYETNEEKFNKLQYDYCKNFMENYNQTKTEDSFSYDITIANLTFILLGSLAGILFFTILCGMIICNISNNPNEL